MSTTASARLLLHATVEGVRWALVAANGRVLGRSPRRWQDPAAARADFLALCPLLPELPVSFGIAAGGRGWTWTVGDPTTEYAAISAVRYERHATARVAFARFVTAAAGVCDTTRSEGPVRPGQR